MARVRDPAAAAAAPISLPFDPGFQRASGEPVPVIVGAGLNFSPTASQDGRRIAFAVGNNLSNNIWRAALDPKTGTVTGSPVRLTSGVDSSVVPSPSRDGKRLAYLGSWRKAPEVRIRDLDSGADLRLAGAKEWTFLVLSPDGSMVAFNSDVRIGSAIYSASAAGGVIDMSKPYRSTPVMLAEVTSVAFEKGLAVEHHGVGVVGVRR